MGWGAGGKRVLHIPDDIPFPHNFLNFFLSNSTNKNDTGLYLAKKLVSLHAQYRNALHDRTMTTELYQHPYCLIHQWSIVQHKRPIKS